MTHNWREKQKQEAALRAPDCEKLNKAVSDADSQRNKLSQGIANPGATDAGIRNVNRQMAPLNQLYNNAKVVADVSGCQ